MIVCEGLKEREWERGRESESNDGREKIDEVNGVYRWR